MEIRLHPNAPFGVVSARSTSPITTTTTSAKGTFTKETGKIETYTKLIDFGEKAKSELPDLK